MNDNTRAARRTKKLPAAAIVLIAIALLNRLVSGAVGA
jgi:hypothetical protein